MNTSTIELPPDRAVFAEPGSRRAMMRWWLRGWWAVTYFISGMYWFAIPVTLMLVAVLGFSLLPVLFLGAPLLLLLLLIAPWYGTTERYRIRFYLNSVIHPPSPGAGKTGIKGFLAGGRRWKPLAYAIVQAIWAPIAGTVTTALVVIGLLGLTLPIMATAFDTEVVRFGRGVATTVGGATLCLLMAFITPIVANVLSAFDIRLGKWLLGIDEAHQIVKLTGEVKGLAQSRTAAVDSAETERRRIERDLHDGPQQKLVAIAMDVAMAQDVIDEDPTLAKEILAKVKSASKESIAEMRQVARGTIPPILTDRGLDAAVSAVAARCSVPATVSSNLKTRLPTAVESTAYYVVSEAITNVAKHSKADSVDIALNRTSHALAIVVEDTGCGGADITRGTGLVGLRQRLAAVDGTLQICSPPGGPTVVEAKIPLPETQAPQETQ